LKTRKEFLVSIPWIRTTIKRDVNGRISTELVIAIGKYPNAEPCLENGEQQING